MSEQMTDREAAALAELRAAVSSPLMRVEFSDSFSLRTGASLVSARLYTKRGERWKRADVPILVAPKDNPTRAGLLRMLADLADTEGVQS